MRTATHDALSKTLSKTMVQRGILKPLSGTQEPCQVPYGWINGSFDFNERSKRSKHYPHTNGTCNAIWIMTKNMRMVAHDAVSTVHGKTAAPMSEMTPITVAMSIYDFLCVPSSGYRSDTVPIHALIAHGV